MKAIIIRDRCNMTQVVFVLNKLSEEDEERVHECAHKHSYDAVVRDITPILNVDMILEEIEMLAEDDEDG